MLEQTVASLDGARRKTLSGWLRAAEAVLLSLWILGEILGFTLAGVFWDTNRTVFFQAALSLAALSIPVLLVLLLLHRRVNALNEEFDYQLCGPNLSVWRVFPNRRRLLFSCSLESAALLKPYPALSDSERRLLKGAVIACCNPAPEGLTVLSVKKACFGRKERSAVVLLELSEPLLRAARRAARSAAQ